MVLKEFLSFLFPSDNHSIISQPILEIFLTIVVNGPLIEEIVYRGFLIGFISQILLIIIPPLHYTHLNSRSNDFPFVNDEINFKRTLIFRILQLILVIISSYFFSLDHLSYWGNQTLYHYFVSGAIFGFLYLRYGFNSSLAWHIYGNLVSLISIKFSINILIYYLIIFISFIIFLIIYEYKHIIIDKFFQLIAEKSKVVFIFWIVLCSIIYFLNGNTYPNDPPIKSLMLLSITGTLIMIDLFIQQVISKIRLRKKVNASN